LAVCQCPFLVRMRIRSLMSGFLVSSGDHSELNGNSDALVVPVVRFRGQ
jgi:hypothetical protein